MVCSPCAGRGASVSFSVLACMGSMCVYLLVNFKVDQLGWVCERCICAANIELEQLAVATQLRYHLNLQPGKWQLCATARAEAPGPWGTALGCSGWAGESPVLEQLEQGATLPTSRNSILVISTSFQIAKLHRNSCKPLRCIPFLSLLGTQVFDNVASVAEWGVVSSLKLLLPNTLNQKKK